MYLLTFQKKSIFVRGSSEYNKRRLVHNGLCDHIYPDWVVVPYRTEDVAIVIQLTNKYNISIRDHTHITSSLKREGFTDDIYVHSCVK